MEGSSADKHFAIPPALPAILKGFARETLRAQPKDLYKFAAQYFRELHASASYQTQPGLFGDEVANLQANLLQHFLDEDRDSVGLLHRFRVQKALSSRHLALSKRQIQLATASCDEDPEGLMDYRTFSFGLAKLILQAQATKEPAAQSDTWRGLTRSELEAAFTNACQQADSDGVGCLNRQGFKECLQSPALGLCRKDVNLLLGQMQANSAEYQALAPQVFDLLAARLADELALNEHLASAKALSQYLLEQLKKQNAQPAGSVPLTALVTALRSFSSDCLGLSTITLACIAGHACVSVSDSVKYEAWAPAAAAMMYSMLDPSTAATRQAAVHEFKRKDEAAKSRSAAVQAIQGDFQQAFQEADGPQSEALSKQDCAKVLASPALDALGLAPQESMGLRAAVIGDARDKFTNRQFQQVCAEFLVQMEREEYVFAYAQAHT